jgi:hypothetical protein
MQMIITNDFPCRAAARNFRAVCEPVCAAVLLRKYDKR